MTENFYARFAAALAEIKQPPMRGKRHPSMGGGAYMLLPDLLGAVVPVLAQHGLCLHYTSMLSEDGIYMRVTCTVTDGMDRLEGSVTMAVTSPGRGDAKPTPHAVGSTLTYAKRYALGLVVPIGTDEDDDGDAGQQHATRKPAAKPAPKSAPRDVGARYAAVGSMVKSAIALGELPASTPTAAKDAMRDPDVAQQVAVMVGEALSGKARAVNTRECSDDEMARAADYWRQKRPGAEVTLASGSTVHDPIADIPL